MTSVTEKELIDLINSNQCKSIKINGKSYWIGKKVKDEIKKRLGDKEEHEGGFAFLAAIPAIIAGLASTAGIATGIASTVSNSRDAIKKQKETELVELQKKELVDARNRGEQLIQIEKLEANKKKEEENKTVSGLYLKPYQGSAIHKYLKNSLSNSDLQMITKNFKKGLQIKTSGDGIYLNPYDHKNH